MGNLQLLGSTGEQYVVNYLKERQVAVVDRNWRIRGGEIDIVARESGVIVFIEVKTRTSRTFGDPLEAIDRDKAFRLQRLALAWIATHDSWGQDYRIDCAGVLIEAGKPVVIDYRKGVL